MEDRFAGGVQLCAHIHSHAVNSKYMYVTCTASSNLHLSVQADMHVSPCNMHVGPCDMHVNGQKIISVVTSSLTGKQLRVFSLTSNKKKCLSENCAGHFTTDPGRLCMYLYEINLNLADTFPCKVRGEEGGGIPGGREKGNVKRRDGKEEG